MRLGWGLFAIELNLPLEIGRCSSIPTLVDGVIFQLPNLNGGHDDEIHTDEWYGLDGRIIGNFLGYLSAQSYIEHGFTPSAHVVGKNENKPSDIFFEWMKDIDVLPDLEEHAVLAIWEDQVTKALRHDTSGG